MARTSSPGFDEHERPTAKRGRPDDVDMANAANRTQKLNARELLGDALEPRATTSGTRRAPTPEEIARFAADRAAAKDAEPAPVSAPVARARFVVGPVVLGLAVVLALLVGFVAGRVL